MVSPASHPTLPILGHAYMRPQQMDVLEGYPMKYFGALDVCVGNKYTGWQYFGLEVKEQVGRGGRYDGGNYTPICPLATSSVKIKRWSLHSSSSVLNLGNSWNVTWTICRWLSGNPNLSSLHFIVCNFTIGKRFICTLFQSIQWNTNFYLTIEFSR